MGIAVQQRGVPSTQAVNPEKVLTLGVCSSLTAIYAVNPERVPIPEMRSDLTASAMRWTADRGACLSLSRCHDPAQRIADRGPLFVAAGLAWKRGNPSGKPFLAIPSRP